MSNIIQVLSNIKHNGEFYATGSLIEAQAGEFQQLINDGAIRVVEGAKSITHARELLSKEVANTVEEVEEIVESQDTWGAAPDPIVTEEVKEVAPPVVVDTTVATPEVKTEVVAPVVEGAEVPVINADIL